MSNGHSLIESAASWATIVSGFGVPLSAVVAWSLMRLRKIVREEVGTARAVIKNDVVPKLTNDDRTAAQYAHQACDIATRALEMAVVTDARLKRVEDKLDNYILSHLDLKKSA
jgi:hypothetical protein